MGLGYGIHAIAASQVKKISAQPGILSFFSWESGSRKSWSGKNMPLWWHSHHWLHAPSWNLYHPGNLGTGGGQNQGVWVKLVSSAAVVLLIFLLPWVPAWSRKFIVTQVITCSSSAYSRSLWTHNPGYVGRTLQVKLRAQFGQAGKFFAY